MTCCSLSGSAFRDYTLFSVSLAVGSGPTHLKPSLPQQVFFQLPQGNGELWQCDFGS
jgi:hypothetical protein